MLTSICNYFHNPHGSGPAPAMETTEGLPTPPASQLPGCPASKTGRPSLRQSFTPSFETARPMLRLLSAATAS